MTTTRTLTPLDALLQNIEQEARDLAANSTLEDLEWDMSCAGDDRRQAVVERALQIKHLTI